MSEPFVSCARQPLQATTVLRLISATMYLQGLGMKCASIGSAIGRHRKTWGECHTVGLLRHTRCGTPVVQTLLHKRFWPQKATSSTVWALAAHEVVQGAPSSLHAVQEHG